MKDPFNGMTVGEFRDWLDKQSPLVVLGRMLAPKINAQLNDLDRTIKAKKAKPGPDSYCPGCGDLSSWAPDLCPECLAVNTPDREPSRE